jgi:hypothetical protein
MKNVSIQINVPKKIVNVETSLFSVWVSDVGTHRIVWLSSDIHIDRSLNESVVDKIRKYHSTYNNNPPNTISFMSDIDSTSGRLNSEFVRLLFLAWCSPHNSNPRFGTFSQRIQRITLNVDGSP